GREKPMSNHPNSYPKLHNAMWPGLVGKEPGTDHPPISLDRMLELTASARVNGHKFEGVDLFLFHPHTDPDASDDAIRAMAAKIAKDHEERLGAEGEICWAGMHSWKTMLDLLNEVGMRDTVGFQADQAHTYLYLLGYNAPEHALLKPGYTQGEFDAAFTKMT